MFDYSECGVTQKLICKLSGGHNPSTISRWIAKSQIDPLGVNGEAGKSTYKKSKYSVSDVRKILRSYVYGSSFEKKGCSVLNFYNFKGGTGKTSICYQVSSHLSLMGFNVLVIDADPQAHLSSTFGFDNYHSFPTIYDVLNNTVSVQDAIHKVYDGMDCIPSNLTLTRLEVLLNESPKREERVKIAFEKIKNAYDFIIFDTNPNISLLNRNIIVFSDLLNIVCETQPYSLNGLKLLVEDLERFCNGMLISFPELLVIPNKYEDRSSSSAEAMTVLRKYYWESMMPDFAVRKSEDIITSSKTFLPLAFFARSNSIAFEDIIDLCRGIIDRLKTTQQEKRTA